MMNTKSVWQFVKDGVVGVAIVLLIFLMLTPMLLNYTGSFFENIRVMFFISEFRTGRMLGPMPFIILTSFISVGFGGRFFDKVTLRKHWIMPTLKISGVSFLVGLIFIEIYYFADYWVSGRSFPVDIINFMGIFVVADGIGLIIGVFIGGLAGMIFNPQKRLYKIVICAIPSALAGYGVAFLILVIIALGNI